MKRVLLSWSSGKDSAWTLHVLRRTPGVEVVGLLTTFNAEADRVAMHAVRRRLVEAQAAAAEVPLWPVPLPFPCSNTEYEERMGAAIGRAREEGITHVAFGDLFLEDVRDYRIRMMSETGIEPLFPLWCSPADTPGLARKMVREGLKAVLTCVDPKRLPESFGGRTYDDRLLSDLPPEVDPCGERGEFHTYCFAGPMFASEIAVEVGETLSRDGFSFTDLVPAASEPERDREAAHARFLRGLAHEVRTPLASILMLTELLTDGPDGLSAKQLDQVRKIRQAAADVNLLIDQVSTLAKVADGGLTASPSAVDLEELVGELEEELGARARENGFEVEVAWEPNAPRKLSTDRLILRQALRLLLEHALGATREGGVTLTVASTADELAIAVRDQGSAVPEEKREALFELFPSAALRTRRSTRGTALALPLARALAGLLGGELELESGRRRGATLTLLVPLVPDPIR